MREFVQPLGHTKLATFGGGGGGGAAAPEEGGEEEVERSKKEGEEGMQLLAGFGTGGGHFRKPLTVSTWSSTTRSISIRQFVTTNFHFHFELPTNQFGSNNNIQTATTTTAAAGAGAAAAALGVAIGFFSILGTVGEDLLGWNTIRAIKVDETAAWPII